MQAAFWGIRRLWGGILPEQETAARVRAAVPRNARRLTTEWMDIRRFGECLILRPSRTLILSMSKNTATATAGMLAYQVAASSDGNIIRSISSIW